MEAAKAGDAEEEGPPEVTAATPEGIGESGQEGDGQSAAAGWTHMDTSGR